MKTQYYLHRNVCVCMCVFCAHCGKVEVKIHKTLITIDTETSFALIKAIKRSSIKIMLESKFNELAVFSWLCGI